MAEGDTIHRAARKLEAALAGRTLVVATAPNPQSPLRLQGGRLESLVGRRLERARAHGKHLFLHFDGGLALHSHQGISGSWRVFRRSSGWKGEDRAWAVLATEEVTAAQFGGPRLAIRTEGELRGDLRLRALGPDVLDERFTTEIGRAALRSVDQRRELGEVLLDQQVLAGIGNVFKAEACFAAGVNPWRRLGEIGDEELDAVVTIVRDLMTRGATRGRAPAQVYRRAGRPCPRCRSRVRSLGQGDANRMTYWCPRCQADRPPEGG